MTNFLKQKNRPIIIGAFIGLVIGIGLITISFGCETSYRIPDGGGYTSEDVWGCLVPLTPTVMLSYLFQTVLQIKEPGIGVGFFVFHTAFYVLIGLFIGWIFYKVKQRKEKS